MAGIEQKSKQYLANELFSGAPGFYSNALDNLSAYSEQLLENIKYSIKVKDVQQFVNKGTWYNLPNGIDQELLERIIYYRFKATLFYVKENKTFYFLPFSLDGDINVYSRYREITPIPFGQTADGKDIDKPWIDGLKRTPVYEVLIPEQLTKEVIENACVILNDHTLLHSQNSIPANFRQEPLIDLEASIVALARTAIMNKAGTKGVRTNGPEEGSKIIQASKSKWLYALAGYTYLPIEQMFEKQDLDDANSSAPIQEFMQMLQAVDNMRLDNLGIRNGGVFEKQGTILQTEADYGLGSTQIVEDDYVRVRQNFCNIVNSIWNLGIWYEPKSQMNDYEPSEDQAGTNQMYENELNNSEKKDGASND